MQTEYKVSEYYLEGFHSRDQMGELIPSVLSIFTFSSPAWNIQQ